VVTYVAPMLLGAGRTAVADLGITTIADAFRPSVRDITVLPDIDGEEPNVRLTLTPLKED
jgi:diaminohydroxyphosphoribosylaminopyrimidine deaminase/5-amino-6-(5-phosphoribosylamino)uracil reductase